MRLDGGALFGHVPRALWGRWLEPDDQGRILLQNRSLLVREASRNVLFEAGVGPFFEPRFKERYGVSSNRHDLLYGLEALGLRHEDIDWVVLSHLHFDHVGGLLTAYEASRQPRLLFPKAQFLVTRAAWERACSPHSRDRASFARVVVDQLGDSSRLVVVEGEDDASRLLGSRFRFHVSAGHTPGMLHTTVVGQCASLHVCADLIPGVPWVHLPVTTGYDRQSETLVDEKRALYAHTNLERTHFCFAHDPNVAACRIWRGDDGYHARDAIASFLSWDIDQTDRPTQS